MARASSHRSGYMIHYLVAYPGVVCLRPRIPPVTILLLASVLVLFAVSLDLTGYPGAINLRYFSEFVAQTILTAAGVLAMKYFVQ
jgi:hypothetical protein